MEPEAWNWSCKELLPPMGQVQPEPLTPMLPEMFSLLNFLDHVEPMGPFGSVVEEIPPGERQGGAAIRSRSQLDLRQWLAGGPSDQT